MENKRLLASSNTEYILKYSYITIYGLLLFCLEEIFSCQ